MNAWIIVQVIRARQATGQDDHIEGIIDNLIQGGVRQQGHAAGGFYGSVIQTGGDHLYPGASQKIGDGDGFKFFTSLGEGDEYACHMMLPSLVSCEAGTNSTPCCFNKGNSSASTATVSG